MSLFIANAYAQTAAAPVADGSVLAMVLSYAPLVLVFGVFYFLVLRPQNAAAKAHATFIASLKTGDNVLTDSGIIGTVKKVDAGFARLAVAADPDGDIVITVALPNIRRALTEVESLLLKTTATPSKKK